MSEKQQLVEQPKARPPALVADMEARGILPIIPRDTEEAQRYARGMISAGIVPDAYREGGRRENPVNAELVLMGVLKSMELGLPPQTGIGTIMPVNNRFTVWGDGAVALIQRNNVITSLMQVELGGSFDRAAPIGDWPAAYGWRVSIARRGQEAPYVGEFTIADAKRAGLWLNAKRQPWILYPSRMLFNRARAFALRDGFADCLMGLGIREEIEDITPPIDARAISTAFLDDEAPAEPEAESATA